MPSENICTFSHLISMKYTQTAIEGCCVPLRGQVNPRRTSLNSSQRGLPPVEPQRRSKHCRDAKVRVSNLVLLLHEGPRSPHISIQQPKTQAWITLIEHQPFCRANKGLLLCGKRNGLWQAARAWPLGQRWRLRGGRAQSLLSVMMKSNEGTGC